MNDLDVISDVSGRGRGHRGGSPHTVTSDVGAGLYRFPFLLDEPTRSPLDPDKSGVLSRRWTGFPTTRVSLHRFVRRPIFVLTADRDLKTRHRNRYCEPKVGTGRNEIVYETQSVLKMWGGMGV